MGNSDFVFIYIQYRSKRILKLWKNIIRLLSCLYGLNKVFKEARKEKIKKKIWLKIIWNEQVLRKILWSLLNNYHNICNSNWCYYNRAIKNLVFYVTAYSFLLMKKINLQKKGTFSQYLFRFFFSRTFDPWNCCDLT